MGKEGSEDYFDVRDASRQSEVRAGRRWFAEFVRNLVDLVANYAVAVWFVVWRWWKAAPVLLILARSSDLYLNKSRFGNLSLHADNMCLLLKLTP